MFTTQQYSMRLDDINIINENGHFTAPFGGIATMAVHIYTNLACRLICELLADTPARRAMPGWNSNLYAKPVFKQDKRTRKPRIVQLELMSDISNKLSGNDVVCPETFLRIEHLSPRAFKRPKNESVPVVEPVFKALSTHPEWAYAHYLERLDQLLVGCVKARLEPVQGVGQMLIATDLNYPHSSCAICYYPEVARRDCEIIEQVRLG
ncbi:hypothetical protein ACLPJK_26590 [Pseudomonas aeruginosa]|uniref:hypothetical protein n=1 Tax=Pseudomonas aeruginosa TaxID=287 RepID=UPI003D2B46F7